MKKALILTFLIGFGFISRIHAALISKTISSATFVNNDYTSGVLYLLPRESMNYSLSGSASGTIHLERSFDGSNFTILLSSTNNSSTGRRTGTEYAGETAAFYRWRASTMAASVAGGFSVTLEDNDDFVGELRNNKKVPSVTFTDDRVYMPKLNMNPTGDTSIAMAITSTFTVSTFPRSYVLVTSTGGAITMTSVPTISTSSAVIGDIYIIQSTTATITLQDDGTLSGSALELGSTTRALGVGDILGLIYRGGKWWELFFANN